MGLHKAGDYALGWQGRPGKHSVKAGCFFAPMDLFDWLDIIGKLREEGLTQAQIGERIGWSREAVKNYIAVLDKIGTDIRNITKQYQFGRVPSNGTVVPFDFTEYWFRCVDNIIL